MEKNKSGMYNSVANDARVIVVSYVIYDDDFMSIGDHHTDNVTTWPRSPNEIKLNIDSIKIRNRCDATCLVACFNKVANNNLF